MLFPLTKPQRQIYDIEKFYSGGVGQLCGGILLDSLVPEDTLDHVADALRRLNDALRLRIVRTGEGPMQEAVPYVPEHPEIFRFSSRKELDDFAAAWTREPLDPDRPLCEIRLAYLPDRCGILVKLNHMLGDEWSFLLLASIQIYFHDVHGHYVQDLITGLFIRIAFCHGIVDLGIAFHKCA